MTTRSTGAHDRKRRRRLRVNLLLGVAILAAGLGVALYATNALRSLELQSVDARFSIRGEERPRSDVLVVGVDSQTYENVGGARGWPFAHDIYARLIDRLRKAGAKVIALDIQFSERSDFDKETLALLDAIDRANNVVESTTEVDDLGNGNAFTYYVPDRIVESKTPRAMMKYIERDLDVVIANGSYSNDPGGVIRRLPSRIDGLTSFPVAVAEKATGRKVDQGDFDDGNAWIDYYGPPGTVKEIPFVDVLRGRTKSSVLRDKIVVVGATAPVLQDVHPTATSGNDQMAGPEIQAQAIGTVLDGFPLGEPSDIVDVILVVLFALLAPLASLRMPALKSFGIAVVVGVVYTVIVQVAFNAGEVLPFVYPLAALGLGSVGALAVYYVTEAFERERTRDMFARFVPPEVVGQALEESDGLRLGGVGLEATVMFSDMRGFTSFAESIEPDQVITILNRYLTAMVDDAILPHGGTLVDYMGDGIMAVFGAPIPMDDHADRALAAARDKLEELEKFNDWLQAEYGFDKRFQMGIGLNTGRVMSGNVGSEQRMAYTAIGDTTNTAARLEAMTKGTPYMIFMSDSTKTALTSDPNDLVFVDDFEIRGREQTVRVWSVQQSTKGSDGGTYQSVASTEATTRGDE